MNYVLEIGKWLFNRWCTTAPHLKFKVTKKIVLPFFINEKKIFFSL